MIDDKGLEEAFEKLNTMPLHLGVFILSNRKRILKKLSIQLMDFIQMMFIMEILIVYILKKNIRIN